VIRVLESLGFIRIRQSGSHAIYHHADGRWTTVPIHKGKNLGKGILRKIIKDARLSVDEFVQLLK
jgi:predicted RNA binding protein YcfA (HicA-like mRNA interferase family)